MTNNHQFIHYAGQERAARELAIASLGVEAVAMMSSEALEKWLSKEDYVPVHTQDYDIIYLVPMTDLQKYKRLNRYHPLCEY